MTARIASLYERFGVLPTCTDSELRKAYRDLLFETHPDQNQHDQDATLKTQRLNHAYAELKRHRAQAASGDQPSVTVSFSFSFAVDVQNVAGIKARFKAAWDALRDQPTDPLRALQFIHAAFQAERGDSDSVVCLLVDPILIDLASILLSDAAKSERDARCATLSRWARYLQSAGRIDDAIQILEDAVATRSALPNLKEELRSHHYAAAQYPHPRTGMKPAPKSRIVHLRRIVELGYDLDYVHKMLAEAYHELGDDEQARTSLEYAYRMNPHLSGAVRITHALGLPAKVNNERKIAVPGAEPRWTRLEHIPAPRQIRVWAERRDWNLVLDFSKPGDYAQRVLPAARGTLRTIAVSLGTSDTEAAESALLGLLNFDYYWDVAEAAATALSKIGGRKGLAALEEYRAKNRYGNHPHVKNCISYLRARIERSKALVGSYQAALLVQAREAVERHDYGLARFLLENLIRYMEREHPEFIEASVLWARSCAKMNDAESAIDIVRPIYTALRDGGHLEAVGEIDKWLWNAACFEEYNDGMDDLYQWVLDLNLSLISMAATPDGVLGPLRRMTRCLEKLGQSASANFVRELIREEAPGTLYVDLGNRENYVRRVTLTDQLEGFLKAFDARIKLQVAPKLKEIMGSAHSIGPTIYRHDGDTDPPRLGDFSDSNPPSVD